MKATIQLAIEIKEHIPPLAPPRAVVGLKPLAGEQGGGLAPLRFQCRELGVGNWVSGSHYIVFANARF